MPKTFPADARNSLCRAQKFPAVRAKIPCSAAGNDQAIARFQYVGVDRIGNFPCRQGICLPPTAKLGYTGQSRSEPMALRPLR